MAKTPTDIRSLARAHTKTALDTLTSIAAAKDAPHSARVSAAIALLDRGWGKAKETVEVTNTHYVVRGPKPVSLEEWQVTHGGNGRATAH